MVGFTPVSCVINNHISKDSINNVTKEIRKDKVTGWALKDSNKHLNTSKTRKMEFWKTSETTERFCLLICTADWINIKHIMMVWDLVRVHLLAYSVYCQYVKWWGWIRSGGRGKQKWSSLIQYKWWSCPSACHGGTQGGAVHLHSYLTLATDGSKWLTSHPNQPDTIHPIMYRELHK